MRTGTIISVFGEMTACFAARKTVADGSDNCNVFSAISPFVTDLTAGAFADKIAARPE